jgi:hypothetical protein
MNRLVAALMLTCGFAALMPEMAASQPVQYQFTPPPPIVALPQTAPSAASIPGVADPVPAPPVSRVEPQTYEPPSSVRPLRSHAPRAVQYGRRTVVVPGRHARSDFGDRVRGCLQAGAGAGVPSGRLGGFSVQCAQ